MFRLFGKSFGKLTFKVSNCIVSVVEGGFMSKMASALNDWKPIAMLHQIPGNKNILEFFLCSVFETVYVLRSFFFFFSFK